MGVPLFQADPTVWDRVVEESSRRLAESCPEASVFHEDRLDFRIVVRAGGPVERMRSRSSGAAFDPGDPDRRGRWVSSPCPDDLPRLAEGNGAEPATEGTWEDEAADPFSDLERALLGVAPETDVVVRGVAFRQTVRVCRGRGPVHRETRAGEWVRVEAKRSRDGTVSTGVGEAVLGSDPRLTLRRVVAEAVERARHRADAKPVDPGTEVAIFAPGVGGLLIHEAFGHALEGDAVARGRSWLGRRGSVVGPPEMTVIDDPRRGRGAWRWDDEAVEARVTTLVRAGRVAGLLLDRKTARAIGAEPTGHGRRASFRDPVHPRMGATFLAAGNAESEEPIAATRHGVFVRRMSNGRTDPATGMTTFRVTDADAIDHGRLCHPVGPFVMTVTPSRARLAIDMIGSKVVFDACIGSCHRVGQPLSTSVGAPTFRLGSIRVIASGESRR